MNENVATSEDVRLKLRYWRKRVFISLWVAYASFYLCRVNISIAIPGILEEYNMTKTAMGVVLTALFFAYAIGQFINGQLGDKFGARKLLTFGAIISAILNLIFAILPGIVSLMALVWGLNGYFQSMGWSPSTKTIANWFPIKIRGKITGLFGSCYQFGNAASWALAGLVVGAFGWRFAFVIPAVVVIVVAIQWYINGRNAPEELGLPTVEDCHEGIMEQKECRKDKHLGFRYTIKTVLSNPRIWMVGFSLFGLNIIRYGFMAWAPTYMFEVEKAAISTAAYKAIAIPLAGSIGALFAGWASDKFFKSRRAPIIVIMLVALMGLTILYPQLKHFHWIWSLICLIAIGFTIYGPHVMIVGAIPMDYASRKATASATGFIDGLGYFGAALTGVISGVLIDKFGWNAAFYFWVIGVFLAVVLMALQWNFKPEKGEYH
ncbi:MAG: MFS transporter [Candidatus Aminicenantaceae bacterium]